MRYNYIERSISVYPYVEVMILSITCNTLLEAKFFKSIELRAGSSGLNRVISWPYIGQTPSITEWVHGGELLFITGVVHEAAMLPNVLEECISKKLAGLVILISNEYIKDIPDNILKRADEAHFPVFSMPWRLKLIDVTKKLSNLIIEDQNRNRDIKEFLNQLLFDNCASEDILLNRASRNGISLPKYSFIALLAYYAEESELEPKEKLCIETSRYCQLKNLPCFTIIYSNFVILLSGAPTVAATKRVMQAIEIFQEELMTKEQGVCYLAFGNIYSDISCLSASFQEARYALKIIQYLSGKKCIHYSNLGIYGLLSHVDDKAILKYFYQSKLKQLLNEEITLIIAGVAVLLLLVMAILIIVNMTQISKLKKKYQQFMGGKEAKSLEQELKDHLDEIDGLISSNKDNKEKIERLNHQIQFAFQKVGMVKYDAFQEMGGKLSFSLCLLNEKDDGFIINAMHSREGCYTYIKEIIAGKCVIILSEEEKEALDMAMQYKL